MTQSIAQYMFKICILGDGGVGKTTLINRYLTGVFKDQLDITIGVDFYVKKLQLNALRVSLQIWDFAGEDRFRFILPTYLFGAVGAIFIYDITRFSSFRNFNRWMQVFEEGRKENGTKIPLLMVGNKKDLDYKRVVSFDDARAIVDSYDGIQEYLECSAKSGENVPFLFERLANLIIERYK